MPYYPTLTAGVGMVVATPQQKVQLTSLSFSTTVTTANRLRAKLPRYGDRSKVINFLLEKYLNGEIEVRIPERRL
jgi:hypothetical protein